MYFKNDNIISDVLHPQQNNIQQTLLERFREKQLLG